MRPKRVCHPLAVVDVDARHRHQILHRDMSGDLPHADALLNLLWEKFNQSQSTAYPTDAAIESTRQVVQVIGEAVTEFLKKPSFFQRRVAVAQPHGMLQHQGLAFTHWPDHRFNGVVAELLEGRDPFIAVNYQITIRVFRDRDDHDGYLLARCGQ